MTSDSIGLQVLLDMNNMVLDQEDGYWIKIQAWQALVTQNVPHGVRYALTLHAPNGKRLMGYDNAHSPKVKTKQFAAKRYPFDHRHRFAADQGVPYAFTSTFQLISDFLKRQTAF